MPSNLAQIKDMLIPGAWILGEAYGEIIDLGIDYRTDSITVRIGTKCHELFSRAEIDDGVYKAEFAPRLMKILETG
jgi:hypothetical protein